MFGSPELNYDLGQILAQRGNLGHARTPATSLEYTLKTGGYDKSIGQCSKASTQNMTVA
jgi:hypothetical protein